VVKPTIVLGFDYASLHWADKQKPLREVAGTFGPFQGPVAPPLVPETPDKEASPVPEEVTLVERVTVTEHFTVINYVPDHAAVRPTASARQP
jgi:hypothetical protein